LTIDNFPARFFQSQSIANLQIHGNVCPTCLFYFCGENHKRIGIDMKILSVLFRLKWYMGSVDAKKSQKRLPHFLLKRRIGQGLNLPSGVLDRITGFFHDFEKVFYA
jgi:hypothetical protein